VKVLDFGLVKEVSSASIGDSMSTIPGQMALGTPGYMAPEMALGEPIDGRADIYAVGCVAYYLVTGETVFEAETALQMIAKHLQSSPIPPSQRTDKPVSPELERLILKCLAKEPSARPQTAVQLAQALEFITADRWGEEEARRWWETNGRSAVPAAVAVLPAPNAVAAGFARPQDR
jgi:serine/threonine-protein kinase